MNLTLQTVNCEHHTLNCTLWTSHFTLYTVNITLYTVHWELHTSHFILHSSLSNVLCQLYTVDIHTTLYAKHSDLYSVQFTVYTVLKKHLNRNFSLLLVSFLQYPTNSYVLLMWARPTRPAALSFNYSGAPITRPEKRVNWGATVYNVTLGISV